MFTQIALKSLKPAKNNYRTHMDENALKELTDSIKSKGVIQPILVRPLAGKDKAKDKKFEIVAGHRRFQAASAAGLKEIPAIVKELSDEEALEVQVIENSQRENPNPIDEAEGFKSLLEMGKHTADTLAEKIGHSVAYVWARLKLVDLDPKVKDAIADGRVGMGHAVLFTRLKNNGDQKEFLKDIIDQNLSVRDAKEHLADEFALELKSAPFDTAGCAACAYRSKNQTVLFADLAKGADTCTDRSCFQTKTKQHYMAVIKAKEAEGFKVLTDAAKIIKLIHNSKTSTRIVASKEDDRSYTPFPPKYKSECAKCTEHHAFYLYEEKNYNGKEIKFGEVCLNKKCLDAMLRAGRKEERRASSSSETGGTSAYTQGVKAQECRNRFLVKTLEPIIFNPLTSRPAASIIRKRLAIFHVMDRFGGLHSSDDWRDEFFKSFLPRNMETGYLEPETIYRLIAMIPEDRLDEAMEKLLALTFDLTDRDVMLHMTPEAGVVMPRDFVMDEEYLTGKTKDELFALIEELGLDGGGLDTGSKKGDIVKAILAQDLVGKVPAAIAEVCEMETMEDAEEEDKGDIDECGEDPVNDDGIEEPEDPITGEAADKEDSGTAPEADPTMPQPTKTKRGKAKSRA